MGRQERSHAESDSTGMELNIHLWVELSVHTNTPDSLRQYVREYGADALADTYKDALRKLLADHLRLLAATTDTEVLP